MPTRILRCRDSSAPPGALDYGELLGKTTRDGGHLDGATSSYGKPAPCARLEEGAARPARRAQSDGRRGLVREPFDRLALAGWIDGRAKKEKDLFRPGLMSEVWIGPPLHGGSCPASSAGGGCRIPRRSVAGSGGPGPPWSRFWTRRRGGGSGGSGRWLRRPEAASPRDGLDRRGAPRALAGRGGAQLQPDEAGSANPSASTSSPPRGPSTTPSRPPRPAKPSRQAASQGSRARSRHPCPRNLGLPRYDGHLSIGTNHGGEPWREERGGIRPSTGRNSSGW